MLLEGEIVAELAMEEALMEEVMAEGVEGVEGDPTSRNCASCD